MQTAELIAQLSAEARPIGPRAAHMRLFAPLAAGAAVSLFAMWAWLGIRPDLSSAAGTWAFWWKFAYTAWIALAGVWLVERLGRPGATSTWPSRWIAVALLVAAAIAAVQLLMAPPPERTGLLLGASWTVCSRHIVMLSLPVLIAAMAGARQLAPVRPAVCGAAAGILAGAAGAWIYAFHCNESAAPFIAIWYTLGIAAMGALGGVLGKWLLRW